MEDWIPQDRLLAFSKEKKELTKELKICQVGAFEAATIGRQKMLAASLRSLPSITNNEENSSSVPAAGQGKKRTRDAEAEEENRAPAKKLKTGENSLCKEAALQATQASSKDLPASENDEEKNSSVSRGRKRTREDFDLRTVSSPESSPGLPGFPKVRRHNNLRLARSPLRLFGASSEPLAKRQRKSPPGKDGEPVGKRLSSKARGKKVAAAPSPPPSSPATKEPSPLAPLSPLNRGFAPPSPPSRKSKRSHPIYGNAIIGSKHRSVNDPWGIHEERTDYPCGELDAVLHRRPEYPKRSFNLWAAPHQKIQADPQANSAKRLFFKEQQEAGVLMIAGIPLEERDSFNPTPPESKPAGRKARGRKGASKKR